MPNDSCLMKGIMSNKESEVKEAKKRAYSAVHLNSNIICAVDCETTGLNAKVHEIFEIAIIPLDPTFKVSNDFTPFCLMIKPENLDTVDYDAAYMNRRKISKAVLTGMERWTAVERFEEWFAGLKLPPGKKIVPLGANCSFDAKFIEEWLGGPLNYENYFRNDFRDVQKAALFINDMCDWVGEKIPFPKVKLTYLCSQLKIPIDRAHSALDDAVAAAEIYRKLLLYKNYGMTALLGLDGVTGIEEQQDVSISSD